MGCQRLLHSMDMLHCGHLLSSKLQARHCAEHELRIGHHDRRRGLVWVRLNVRYLVSELNA
jgi:hypothetical protein